MSGVGGVGGVVGSSRQREQQVRSHEVEMSHLATEGIQLSLEKGGFLFSKLTLLKVCKVIIMLVADSHIARLAAKCLAKRFRHVLN